jgi:hypothetical protein
MRVDKIACKIAIGSAVRPVGRIRKGDWVFLAWHIVLPASGRVECRV